MASSNISCRLFVKISPESAEYRALDVSTIQEQPTDLRRKWIEGITDEVDRDQEYEDGDYSSRRSYIRARW